MIIKGNCRRLLFAELQEDNYYIKRVPTGLITHFVDLGANVGMMSILMRLLHPTVRILAVEPHPDIYRHLVLNTDNLCINTVNLALGDGSTFHLFKERKSNVCNIFSKEPSELSDTTCKSKTFYNILKKHQYITDRTMAKIDCEGGELHILEDEASLNLLKDIAIIGMETHYKSGISIEDMNNRFKKELDTTHNVSMCYGPRLGHFIAIRKDIADGYNLEIL